MPHVSSRDVALVAMFTALLAVLGLPGGISFFGSVPVTLQSFGWMLTACLLGPWRAALTMIVFDLLLIAGMPIAAGGKGGLGVITGPSPTGCRADRGCASPASAHGPRSRHRCGAAAPRCSPAPPRRPCA